MRERHVCERDVGQQYKATHGASVGSLGLLELGTFIEVRRVLRINGTKEHWNYKAKE